MKKFFQKLFGIEPPPKDVQKRAEPAAVSPSPQPAFEPYKKGDVIGGTFEVLRKLGEGGFGVVYLVRLRQTGGLFAVKTFRDELLADPASRESFKKEALLWSNLQIHPRILAARWVQEINGRLFVMMDYVPADSDGRVTLADHIADGVLEADVALKWGIQFCHGMEHAMAHGIRCHRDIKPANILIAQDGTLKISDFGLAAIADVRHEMTDRERMWLEAGQKAGVGVIFSRPEEQGRAFVTQKQDGAFGFSVVQTEGKRMCGTPGYMAPEVYRFEDADTRTDIYSFGLVLWQMVTGSRQPPFLAPWRGDMGGFLRATYEQQIAGRVPAVNSPLSAVINRCLRPQPTERYAGFAELRGDLETIFTARTKARVQVPLPEDKTPQHWLNQGGSLSAIGKHHEALACYDKALALEPRYAHAWCDKGSALERLGRYQESLQCIEKALEIDPTDAITWGNAAYSLSLLGRHEDAIRCCDKSLAIDPQRSMTWSNKGNALCALGRHEDAIACYDKAVGIESRDARGWYGKAGSLCALGRHAEAIQCYAKALAIVPHYASACYGKAESEYALMQWREAANTYTKFLELKSPHCAHLVPQVRERLRELESKGI